MRIKEGLPELSIFQQILEWRQVLRSEAEGAAHRRAEITRENAIAEMV